MRFTPNGNRILLKKTEEEQKTSGGFIIPTQEKGELSSAQVVALGDGVTDKNLISHLAFFKESDALKINIEGESFLIIDNEKVLGFL